MILAVAAGMQPNLTWNPMEPAATITSFIVQVALGDLPHGSIGYQTIFAAGLTLLLITLVFNILGHVAACQISGRTTDETADYRRNPRRHRAWRVARQHLQGHSASSVSAWPCW